MLLPRSPSIPVRSLAEKQTCFKIKTYIKINIKSGDQWQEMGNYRSQASQDLTSLYLSVLPNPWSIFVLREDGCQCCRWPALRGPCILVFLLHAEWKSQDESEVMILCLWGYTQEGRRHPHQLWESKKSVRSYPQNQITKIVHSFY